MDTRFEQPGIGLNDDSVEQMLVLAERLRESNGGVLDDSAVQAVAEATGAPVEYVRLAVKLRAEQSTKSFVHNVRAQYMTLEPETRRYVTSGVTATLCALMSAAESKAEVAANLASQDGKTLASYGIFGMISLIWLTAGLYNISVSRDPKLASISGAIFGGGYCIANAIFCFLLRVQVVIPPLWLVPFTLFGAAAGLVLQRVVAKYRVPLGLKDPMTERQDLLRQLQSLQDKLKSGEQQMTFLSVDIVGSTRMKQLADPLDVEFTFTEYHQFVEMITRKHGGQVHSTAGDGVTCAFPHPQQAFAAARNIQTGMIELNTFRNKIGVPIVVRQAIHTGNVVAPSVEDVKSVHFAAVIDVSAHLQKATPPGTVAVSDDAAVFLPGGPAAVGTTRVESNGVSATVWVPRSMIVEGAATPPIPRPSLDVV